MNIDYYYKYLKYKTKYEELKKIGGSFNESTDNELSKFIEIKIKSKIPHIYTLFDGYLNPDYGSNYYLNLDTLSKILDKFDYEVLLDNDYLDKLKDDIINSHDFYFDFHIPTLYSLYNYDNNEKKYDFNYGEILEKLSQKLYNLENKELIFGNLGTCQHAITFLFKKDYLLIINSGDGINKYHKNIESEKFNLWKSFKYNNKEDFFKKLLLFNLFKNMNEYFTNNVYNPLSDIFSNYPKNPFKLDELQKFLDDIEYIINCFNLYKNSKDEQIPMNKNELHKKQLNFIYEILISDLTEETNENTFLKENFSYDEFYNKWEKKKKENDLTKNIFDRYTFIYIDGNLYCDPQKSGSCAWYSIFWTLFPLCTINNIDVFDFYVTLIDNLRSDLVKDFEETNTNKNILNKFDYNCYKILNLLYNLKYMNYSSYSIYKNFNSLNYLIKYEDSIENNDIDYKKILDENSSEIIDNVKKNFFNKYDYDNFLVKGSTGNEEIDNSFSKFNDDYKFNYNEYILKDLLDEYKPPFNIISFLSNIKITNFFYIEYDTKNYNFENLNLTIKLNIFFNKFINLLNRINRNYKSKKLDKVFNNCYKIDKNIYSDKNEEKIIEKKLLTFFSGVYINQHYTYNIVPFELLNIFEYKNKNYNNFCIYASDLSDLKNFFYVIEIFYSNPNYLKLYFKDDKDKEEFLFKLYKFYFLNVNFISLQSVLFEIDDEKNTKFTKSNNRPNKKLIISNAKKIYLNIINLLLDNFLSEKVFFKDDNSSERISLSSEKYKKIYYNLNDDFDKDKLVLEIKEKINSSNTYSYLKKRIESIDFTAFTNNPFKEINIKNDNIIVFNGNEYNQVKYDDYHRISKIDYVYDILNNFKFNDAKFYLYKNNENPIENYLICLNLNKSNIIKNFDKNIIYIQIKIENEKNIKEFKIDNYDVIIDDNNKNNYPFLLFSPVLTTNYILKKNNTYYLLFLSKLKTNREINIFTKTPLDDKISYMYICEISNNFFIPKFKNIEDYYLLKDIYSYYGCNEEILFNFNFKKNIEYLEKDFRLINDYLPNYNLEKGNNETIKNINKVDIDNLKYCSENNINNNEYYDLKLNFVKIDVLLLKIKENFKLIEFNDNNFDIKDLKKFIEKNPLCTFTAYNNEEIKLEIKNNINSLFKLIDSYRNKLCKNLDFNKFNEGGYFEILKNNYEKFLKIMQINILNKNINRLLNIIENCNENTSCKEFSEISKLLEIPNLERDKEKFILLVFEQIFGNIINQEQWDKFYEIINSYNENKNKIYQFAMGKGKSSVITPLLILYFANDNSIGRINVIIPSHLKCQTIDSLKLIMEIFNLEDNKLNVLTDNDAKLKFLNENEYFSQNDIIIFDEIDLMYDPIKSNFNLIDTDKNSYFEKEHIEFIINKIEKKDNKIEFATIENRVDNILMMENIKNINYGMSKRFVNNEIEDCKINENKTKEKNYYQQQDENSNEYEENIYYRQNLDEINKNINKKSNEVIDRYVIPYERKDSPLEGSQFSSILITLVLTIKYFEEDNYNLEENDFKNMFNNNYFPPEYQEFDNNTIELFIKLSIERQKKLEKDIKINILIDYLDKFVIKNITYSEKVKNCSFIDLMNIKCKWKTGFSGTVNINLLDLKTDNKFETEISKDLDEKLGVYFALTGEYPNSENTLYNLKKSNKVELDDNDKIMKILKDNEYNCLIDVLGYFKDFSNKDIVTYIRDNIEKYSDFDLVYLDDNDNIMLYDGNNYLIFDKFNNTKTFIFFSQKNIVGIDIKNQPILFRGLVIIDENSTYTNVAQGIFRMRKLNKGQIIDVAYFSDIEEKKNMYKKLIDNDNKVKDNKNNYLYLQILKYYFRNINKNYVQDFNTPNFIVESNLNEDIKKILNEKNIKYVRHVLNNHLSGYDKIKVNYSEEIQEIIEIYYNKIIKLPDNDIENLLFGSSNYEKNININIDKDVDVEVDKEINKDFEYNRNIYDDFPKNISLTTMQENNIIYCDEKLLNEIDEFTFSIDDNIKLSVNLFNFINTSYSGYSDNDYNLFMKFFVIKINNKYIFTNLKNDKFIPLDKFPIFNDKLECINYYKLNNTDIQNDNNLKKKLKNIFKVFYSKNLNDEEIDNFNKYINESNFLNLFFMILLKSLKYVKYKDIIKLNKKINIDDIVKEFNNKIINSTNISKLSEDYIRKIMNKEVEDNDHLKEYFNDTEVNNPYSDEYYKVIFDNINVDSFYNENYKGQYKLTKEDFKKAIVRSFFKKNDLKELKFDLGKEKDNYSNEEIYRDINIYFKKIPFNPFEYYFEYGLVKREDIKTRYQINDYKRVKWYKRTVLDTIIKIFEIRERDNISTENDETKVDFKIYNTYNDQPYFIIKDTKLDTMNERCLNIFCKEDYYNKLENYINNLKIENFEYINKFNKLKIMKLFELPYLIKFGDNYILDKFNNFKNIKWSEYNDDFKIFYIYDNTFELTKFVLLFDDYNKFKDNIEIEDLKKKSTSFREENKKGLKEAGLLDYYNFFIEIPINSKETELNLNHYFGIGYDRLLEKITSIELQNDNKKFIFKMKILDIKDENRPINIDGEIEWPEENDREKEDLEEINNQIKKLNDNFSFDYIKKFKNLNEIKENKFPEGYTEIKVNEEKTFTQEQYYEVMQELFNKNVQRTLEFSIEESEYKITEEIKENTNIIIEYDLT